MAGNSENVSIGWRHHARWGLCPMLHNIFKFGAVTGPALDMNSIIYSSWRKMLLWTVISYHIISYHILYHISYHIIFYHIISYQIKSYIISYSYHIIYQHISLHTSYHIRSYHHIILTYHITSYHHWPCHEYCPYWLFTRHYVTCYSEPACISHHIIFHNIIVAVWYRIVHIIYDIISYPSFADAYMGIYLHTIHKLPYTHTREQTRGSKRCVSFNLP